LQTVVTGGAFRVSELAQPVVGSKEKNTPPFIYLLDNFDNFFGEPLVNASVVSPT